MTEYNLPRMALLKLKYPSKDAKKECLKCGYVPQPNWKDFQHCYALSGDILHLDDKAPGQRAVVGILSSLERPV